MKARAELVNQLLTNHLPDGTARATVLPCQGAKFHSPMPLLVREYRDEALDNVWLCPTCTDKLNLLLTLHAIDSKLITFAVLREFGNQIRLMGQKIIAARGE